MEHGWAVDINLHDPVTPGPHIKYPHYHDFFELIYVYKGEMHTIVNQKEDNFTKSKTAAFDESRYPPCLELQRFQRRYLQYYDPTGFCRKTAFKYY